MCNREEDVLVEIHIYDLQSDANILLIEIFHFEPIPILYGYILYI